MRSWGWESRKAGWAGANGHLQGRWRGKADVCFRECLFLWWWVLIVGEMVQIHLSLRCLIISSVDMEVHGVHGPCRWEHQKTVSLPHLGKWEEVVEWTMGHPSSKHNNWSLQPLLLFTKHHKHPISVIEGGNGRDKEASPHKGSYPLPGRESQE